MTNGVIFIALSVFESNDLTCAATTRSWSRYLDVRLFHATTYFSKDPACSNILSGLLRSNCAMSAVSHGIAMRPTLM